MRWLDWPIRLRRLTAALYFLALNWMLLAPSETFEEIPLLFPHEDKLIHGGVFLVLALLARWSMAEQGGRHRPGAVAALLLFAGAIETLQPVIGGAGRQFDWLDMACNLAGIGCGWLLYGVLGVPEPSPEPSE